MKTSIIAIADGCCDIMKSTGDMKEAKKLFRLQCQAAYDKGREDLLKEQQKEPPLTRTQPSVPADRAPVVEMDTQEEPGFE